ncbi:MAG: hypothetical protein ACYDEV_17655 [Acidiferrobacter sp.]
MPLIVITRYAIMNTRTRDREHFWGNLRNRVHDRVIPVHDGA